MAERSSAINAAARYVKVQLRDPGFIGLAEVQVWSETQLPVIDVQGNSVSIANGEKVVVVLEPYGDGVKVRDCYVDPAGEEVPF